MIHSVSKDRLDIWGLQKDRFCKRIKKLFPRIGGMAEGLMAAALKAVVSARAPWVRILLPPPYNVFTEFYKTVKRV